MRKIAESCSEIIKRILFIGFGIQIILGVIWMCLNIAHPQVFSADGGFLWRVFANIPHRFSPVMYPVNLAAAIGAYALLARLLGKQRRSTRIFMIAALLTFPPAMQCHLSLSPYSLASSLVIAECCLLYRALKEDRYLRCIAFACACWMLAAWILPEYAILGAIPVLFCIMARKIGLYGLLLALSFGGIICGSTKIAGDKVLPDRRDVAYAMCSRFAWSDVSRIAAELKTGNVLDIEDELRGGVPRADAMKTEFLPRLEERFGEETEAVLGIVSKYGWTRKPTRIIKEVGMDAIAYIAHASIMGKQLKGNVYSSFTGRNYERFCEYAPRIAKYDMAYSIKWLCAAYVLLCLYAVCSIIYSNRPGWTTVYFGLGVTVFILACSLFYTFCGGGIMDYKLTVAGNLFWIFLCLCALQRKGKEI